MNGIFEKVDDFLNSLGVNLERKHLLAAISGGPDSVFLLNYLLWKRERVPFHIEAIHLNHMLRGRESDEDEEFVRRFVTSKNINLIVERVDVKRCREKGETLEEAARRLRYGVFEKYAEDFDWIVTAHNFDDNVETVIFNFFRGGGLNGLAGIKPIRGKYLRPLLTVTKEEITRFLEEKGIPYRIDSSNYDRRFTRNMIRHEIIPFLEEKLGRKVKRRIGENIEIFRNAMQFIDRHILNLVSSICFLIPSGCVLCSYQSIFRLTPFERGEIYRRMLFALGLKGGGSMNFMRGMEEILLHEKEIFREFPGPVTGGRAGEFLFLCDGKFSDLIPSPEKLTCSEAKEWGWWRIRISGKDCNRLPDPAVKGYLPGDRMKILYGGKAITRKLKEIFSSKKIGRVERKLLPVIVDGDGRIVYVHKVGKSVDISNLEVNFEVEMLTREVRWIEESF